MKVSDLFVQALENEGVKYIFGIPGEENLDFLESLKNSNIRLILTRHEQAAGFMAATYGRLKGIRAWHGKHRLFRQRDDQRKTFGGEPFLNQAGAGKM